MMTLTSAPKISIVMPVRNREDTIEKAIRSVLDQQYDNVELIIIDGGSTDNTVEIIKRYESHLTYWHSRPDGSAILAYNFGIEKASGDLVAILMADDWYEPDTFKQIADAYIKQPDADMLTCGGRIVSYDDIMQSYEPKRLFTTAASLHLSFYNICFAASAICCRFIKKSFYDRIGLYIPFDASGDHIFSNDKELLLRAILHHAKDVFVNHLGYTYLAHQGSSTFGNNQANITRLCVEHMDIAQTYLAKSNLSRKQRFLLNYWYNDQSTRLLLFNLLQGKFRTALTTAKEGIRHYHLLWPLAFCYTTCRILIKMSLRKMMLMHSR